MDEIRVHEEKLKDFFQLHKRAALAFSGGVDSAYLLYAAGRYAQKVTAYYVKSAFQPAFELEDAVKLAEELKAEMKILPIDVLSKEEIRKNPSDRCYYCKRMIFERILKEAAADGFDTVIDGTNASDEVSDRPGMRALSELSVFSPLREAELTKTEIRLLSKEAGLFTHDKPAYACLATRIPTGEPVTEEKLLRTEKAEEFLKSAGFADFRVRSSEDTAKLQIRKEQFALLLEKREEIVSNLKNEYRNVLLDLEERK